MSNPFPFRCWAEINLATIAANAKSIRRRLPKRTRYISVIKADGYGLGAARILPPLKEAGVDIFAVANIAEGAELRALDPKIPILLLSATLPGEEDYLSEYNLIPTLSTADEVRRVQAVSDRHGRVLPVHLKFDTGMGRLGTWHDAAGGLLEAAFAAPGLRVEGLYSHLAAAGEDDDFTRLQHDRFLFILKNLSRPSTDLLIHISNSAGLASVPPSDPFNAVRVGLLQFGYFPTPDSPLAEYNVTPAVGLHARVSVVKDMPAGATISYSRTHTLRRDSRIAVVTAGYADGIFRACSNRGQVLVRGHRCPILGNVTMDEIVIDVTSLPEVAPGDLATFFGSQGESQITLNEYSAWSRTIPWENLCALGKRLVRVYA